jgi:hypothetical protein
MKLTVPVVVDAPDGATHYIGDHNVMGFYKRKDIGVAGEHWFYWHPDGKEWKMASHHKPHWIEPIPEEWKK